jgi:hypothetical protein
MSSSFSNPRLFSISLQIPLHFTLFKKLLMKMRFNQIEASSMPFYSSQVLKIFRAVEKNVACLQKKFL